MRGVNCVSRIATVAIALTVVMAGSAWGAECTNNFPSLIRELKIWCL